MGNELSGVLRAGDEDVEVNVKLLIRRKNHHQQQAHQSQQQQQENSVPSEEGDAGGEDSYDDDDDEEDEEDDEEGDERSDKLVDELLENEGDLPPKLTMSGGKRRGRPPKVKGEGSGSGEPVTPRPRKKPKVGAGRPSSVKVRSNSDHPILDVCIAKTHLNPSFCLNVPPEFANAYLDVNKEYTVVDGEQCKFLGLCLKNKRCVVKRSHWKAIVEEHKLKSGDTVHLELIPGDQIRIQVTKCEEGMALDFSDAAQQQVHEAVEKIVHLDQNGHASVSVDLEKHHVVAAVTAPVNPVIPAAAPVVTAPAPVDPASTPASTPVAAPAPAPPTTATTTTAVPAPAEVQ